MRGSPAYSVAVGAVSLALLAPVALVLFAEPLAPQRLPEGLPHLSLLLLAWWLPASFLLTFVGPFQGLSNGYFSTIVAGAGSVQLCRANVPLIDGALSTLHEFARNAPEYAWAGVLPAPLALMAPGSVTDGGGFVHLSMACSSLVLAESALSFACWACHPLQSGCRLQCVRRNTATTWESRHGPSLSVSCRSCSVHFTWFARASADDKPIWRHAAPPPR